MQTDMKHEKTDQAGNYYDLAVIGGGPAGTFAAALAVKAGLSTVIMEKKAYPRSKICGGFISARSISLLPVDLNLISIPSEAIYQVSVLKGRQPRTYNSKTRLGLVVERTALDHLMAGYARAKGAVLLEEQSLEAISWIKNKTGENYTYILETGNPIRNKLTARYVIAADGALGNTARLAGLRNNKKDPRGWGLSKVIKARSKVAETGAAKFYPLPFLGGMGWSLSGPDWTNQGVGGFCSKSRLQKAYQSIFNGYPDPAGLLSWPLPFLGPLKKAASNNLLLIGDAAGLVDPFSGEGLYNSFKSAILAVRSITEAGKENKPAGELYNELFKINFRRNFAASLSGAILLHARAVLSPSSLPSLIASLMENRLWFNRDIDYL